MDNTNTPTIVIQGSKGPGLIVRALYFIFVGWWVSLIWIVAAWILNLTIVGLPIGLAMLNRVPQVMTLSPGSQHIQVVQVGGITTVAQGTTQYPMWARAIYFLFVGWWASALWTVAAYLLCILFVTLPIGLGMFNVIGFITTLRKN
jgi:uncharacterized membrane protein YccF (DUF307 family)